MEKLMKRKRTYARISRTCDEMEEEEEKDKAEEQRMVSDSRTPTRGKRSS